MVYWCNICTLQFDVFYTGKYNGRTLTWLHHHSLADVHLTYLKKPYTVCVTTYQMIVLCAFNECDQYSLASLGQRTLLSPQDLSAILLSLLNCKLLLEKEEGEEEEEEGGLASDAITSSTNYILNKNYFNKRTKFKITASTPKDTQQVTVYVLFYGFTNKCSRENQRPGTAPQ